MRWTVVAIGIVAFAACDLVHEVLGHGVAAWMVRDVSAISLSSVALQTSGESRIVAAAGSIANVVVGLAALALFRRKRGLTPLSFFLWLLGATDLLNGTGYPLYSAILGSGDWAVVVRGLEPAWMWNVVVLGMAGVIGYAAAVVVAARALARLTSDAAPLVVPAYVAGSALLVAASVLNPIGPSLILLSGVSSGFAAMAGLLVVPRLAAKWGRVPGAGVSYSLGWIVAGALVAVVFVAVLGPGISL
jgi:hypothetical protein